MPRSLALLASITPRFLALLVAVWLVPASTRDAAAQSYRAFGDWVVACDNVRDCSAIAFAAENEANAFIKLDRLGARGSQVTALVALADSSTAVSNALTVMRDGRRLFAPLPAIGDGEYLRSHLPAPDVAILMRAVHSRSIEIVATRGGKPIARGRVLLGETPAALAHFAAPFAPPAPLPVVRALPMTEVHAAAAPLPPNYHPDGVACADAPELWLQLSPQRRLRGLCSIAGAYNIEYQFYFVSAGGTLPAHFYVPWRARDRDAGGLVNPSLSAGGATISAFFKDVGYGGCGESSNWAWTGRSFALVHLSEMHTCRGVPTDDWPIVYRARRM